MDKVKNDPRLADLFERKLNNIETNKADYKNKAFMCGRNAKIEKIRMEREQEKERRIAISVQDSSENLELPVKPSPKKKEMPWNYNNAQKKPKVNLWEEELKRNKEQYLETGDRKRDLSERFRNSYAESKRYKYDLEGEMKMKMSANVIKSARGRSPSSQFTT